MVVIVDNGLQLIYSSIINESQVIEMVQLPSPSPSPIPWRSLSFHISPKNSTAVHWIFLRSSPKPSHTLLKKTFSCAFFVQNAMRNKSMYMHTHLLIKRDGMRCEQKKSNTWDGFVAIRKHGRARTTAHVTFVSHVIRAFFMCKKNHCLKSSMCRYVDYKNLSWAMNIYEDYLWLCQAISNYAHLHTGMYTYVHWFVHHYVK